MRRWERAGPARELPELVVYWAADGSAVSPTLLWQGGLWSSEILRRYCGEESSGDVGAGTEFAAELCRSEVGRLGTRLPTQTLSGPRACPPGTSFPSYDQSAG